MSTRVALHQLLPVAGNPKENFRIMEQAISGSAGRGAEINIFPEDFLHGVIRGKDIVASAGREFSIWIELFCRLAERYGTELLPGTLPFYNQGRVYNTGVYINKNGQVLNQYSKHNLWLSERSDYESSLKMLEVFETKLGKTGMIVCWDIFAPRLFEALIMNGAEWIIIPAFWSKNQSKSLRRERGKVERGNKNILSDSKILDALLLARTYEYNVGLIFCNFGGTHIYKGKFGLDKAVSANRTQIIRPLRTPDIRVASGKQVSLTCDLEDISETINDAEIYYGRRADTRFSCLKNS